MFPSSLNSSRSPLLTLITAGDIEIADCYNVINSHFVTSPLVHLYFVSVRSLYRASPRGTSLRAAHTHTGES